MNSRGVSCLARRRRLSPVVVILIGILLSLHQSQIRAQEAAHPIADATGLHANRLFLGDLSFERIDTLTGNLGLTFTDLVLPGYGTMDVIVQRSYDSKTRRWTFGFAGVPHHVRNPDGPPPAGEPMPPFPPPEPPDLSPFFPVFLTADGGEQQSYADTQTTWTSSPTVFTTADFWRYHVDGRRLELPNGVECVYDALGHLREVRDAFSNRLVLTWEAGRLEALQQILGDGRTRTIAWTPVSAAFGAAPATMTVNGRTWTYQERGAGSMRPPVGPGWTMEYAGGELSAVVTPEGGRVAYTYADHHFTEPGASAGTVSRTRVVKTRTVAGRAVEVGQWTFSYSGGLGAENVVDGPDGVKHVFHYGPGHVGLVLQRHEVWDGASLLERLEHGFYGGLAVTDWSGIVKNMPTSVAITRGTQTYTTTLTYHSSADRFADYGRPWKITASGDAGSERSNEHSITTSIATSSIASNPRP